MCTVVVRVAPPSDRSASAGSPSAGSPSAGSPSAWPVTMIALRDEDPDRPWDEPGAWWPDRDPAMRGVHDRSAGGAWLAASDTAGLAVVLNRWEDAPTTDGTWTTRGAVPLDAVVDGVLPGAPGSPPPTSRAFNLLRATPDGTVTVTSWDGAAVVTTTLPPGVHMLTHGAPDDQDVPRIRRWLPAFAAAAAPTGPPALGPLDELRTAADGAPDDDGWAPWFGILAESAALGSGEPEAILRDHTGLEGRFATLSIVAAAIGPDGTVLRHARLAEPGTLDGSVALRHA